MKTITLDFDGTVVMHKYPHIGEDIGAVPVLKKLVEHGHRLILFTMRSGKSLDDAVEWFKTNKIPLFGIQENPENVEWTTSPKPHSDLIIDDICLNIPLVNDGQNRPYVDWFRVDSLLRKIGYY